MVYQRAAPRVEDGHDGDQTADVVGIVGQLDQGLGGGPHQDRIEGLLVASHQVAEFVGDGQDEVEVWDGQQFLAAAVQPCFGVFSMTFGAGAVAAGVVGIMLLAATIADVEYSAHGGGSAVAKVSQGSAMAGQHVPAETFQILGAVETEDVSQLGHDERSKAATGRPSGH